MKKRGIIATNLRFIFIAIILLVLVVIILSAYSSITGNVFVKTIQKANITQTNTTIMGEDMLVYLNSTRRTLAVGERWSNFAFGYDIQASSIDARANPKQAWIAVYKDGILKDDAVVNEGDYYDYVEDYLGYNNLIVFRIKMSRIFAGATSDMVDLRNNYVSSAAVDACNPEWECQTSECLNYKIKREDCADSNGCHKSESQPPAIEICQGNKTLSVGETWYMGHDSYIQAISIDARASPKMALLALTSVYSVTGLEESRIAEEGGLFEIIQRWEGYDNVTVFSTKIDSIYAGATSDMARLKDTYLLAANLCSCEQLWRCGAWGSCINGRRTRACIDLSNCSSRWTASDLEIDCDVGLPLTTIACGPSVSYQGVFSANLSARNASQVNATQESQNVSSGEIVQNQTGTQIIIERESEERSVIRIGDSVVETPLDITEESSRLYINNSEGERREIFFPSNAISKILESGRIERIVLEKENEKAIYHVYSTKRVKLFLIFSALLNEELKIDAESGEIIEIKKPWWSFLAKEA